MEHKNAGRHSGKIYRLFELLGHTEGQLYIAEIAVLITLLIGTAVYILLLRVLPFVASLIVLPTKYMMQMHARYTVATW